MLLAFFKITYDDFFLYDFVIYTCNKLHCKSFSQKILLNAGYSC